MGSAVEVLEYGARLKSHSRPASTPRADQHRSELRLAAEYELDTAALGSIIGRCANRTVARAHPEFQLSCNDGANHLHGGAVGFGRSLWRATACVDGDMPAVSMELHSPDGEEGYRGNVSVKMELRLDSPLSFKPS